MNQVDLWTAIRTRLTGHEELMELVSTQVYHAPAPDKPTYPYLTYDVAAIGHDDTFDMDVAEVTFRIHLWADRQSTADTVCSTILEMVYGDATEQADRVPEYGLHRHALDLGEESSWTGSTVTHLDSLAEHEKDVYHFIEEFRVYQSRRTPAA